MAYARAADSWDASTLTACASAPWSNSFMTLGSARADIITISASTTSISTSVNAVLFFMIVPRRYSRSLLMLSARRAVL